MSTDKLNPQDDDILSKLPRKEIYGQLLAILTNRRRTSSENLVIGFSQAELSQILEKKDLEIQDLMEEFNRFLLSLGLSIAEFEINNKPWFAIKSLYAAPIELLEEELVVLGTILLLLSKQASENIIQLEQLSIIQYLTTRGYFNEYKLKKILKNLIQTGYLIKNPGSKYSLGPRTMIELSEDSRRDIAHQAEDLLF